VLSFPRLTVTITFITRVPGASKRNLQLNCKRWDLGENEGSGRKIRP
jgi:hypothetical protein